jgi:hypothetical protein
LGVFCYPWDLVGDPAAPRRLAELGVDTVTLPAAYHSVRAITPHHPAHRIVQAHHAAAYFPVRAEAWRGQRLRPAAPTWGVPDPDPFGRAAKMVRDVGLKVEAWIVLTHNTRLGLANPDLTVRNAYGDRYPYALCPSHPEVREYARTLVSEVATTYPDQLSGLVLEAFGWLGFDHGSHHDKTGDLTPAEREHLSVCVCEACAAALGTTNVSALLGPQHHRLLNHRATVIEDLLRTTRSAAPDLPITLMAADGLDKIGPDVGVPLAGFAPLVDAYLLKCWGSHEAAVKQLKAARDSGVPALGNVNFLEQDPANLPARLTDLREAGATDFRFYHAGLASPPRLAAFRKALRA